MNTGSNEFLLRVCDSHFGSFLRPSVDEDHVPCFICICCDEVVDPLNWVHAKHQDDCIINEVREYLSLHKPEAVRAHGVDWADVKALDRTS